MVEFKLVLGLKDGKSIQRVVHDPEASSLVGMKIGDKLSGDKIGLAGYEFEVAGGSDYGGFPMRKDLPGTGRKRILITRGKGMRKKGKGLRQRKTVCGNTIHDRISQVNLKVLKQGKAKLEAEKKEDKPKEKPKKAPKDKPKEKTKEKPKKEDKPKEEPKKEAPIKEDKPKEDKK